MKKTLSTLVASAAILVASVASADYMICDITGNMCFTTPTYSQIDNSICIKFTVAASTNTDDTLGGVTPAREVHMCEYTISGN